MPVLVELADQGVAKLLLIIAIGAIATASWAVVTIIQNVFFHPLSQFPGPLIQRASSLPFVIQNASGIQAFRTETLHEKYGSVVRISPNHLSFTDSRAWKDIYGHRVGSEADSGEMTKAKPFSNLLDDIPTSILNSDKEEHSRFRRALSHGFSDSSMRQQEPLITKYVDLLITRLGQECRNGKVALNMEAWYNWTTFDIVGNLVFGESFGCLENTEYHPWISSIFKGIRLGTYLTGLSYLGFHNLVQVIFRTGGVRAFARTRDLTDKMVSSRLELSQKRDDLFEGLVKRRKEWNLSFQKISANANILVLAGSETTATTLSGVTYLLLAHPETLEKLTAEVRSSFSSAEDINIASVSKMTYMLAVLNEALRLYPPVTANLVRTVPPGGRDISGHYVPAGTFVEVQHWSMNRSEKNWADPLKFQPERFLDDPKTASEAGNNLEALNAFSVGPRNCIGRNLAYAEMRLILARIVYSYDMTLADDSKDWIKRQKCYALWERIPLNVYLTPV